MNQQDKEFEDIRSQWQAMKLDNKRLDETNRELSRKLAAERAGNRRHRLAVRYRATGILSVFLLPLLAMLMTEQAIAPQWICILYAIIGAAMGVMNLAFSFFIDGCDYISLPTNEALRHVHKVLLWQARLRCAGMILAAVVLVPLFAHFASLDDSILLVVTIVGLAIGLAIGLTIYNRNRRMARKILADMGAEE